MNANRAHLDPACRCCALQERILDIIDGAEFEDAMAALTGSLARVLDPVLMTAKPGLQRAEARRGALIHVGSQVTDVLAALADFPQRAH